MLHVWVMLWWAALPVLQVPEAAGAERAAWQLAERFAREAGASGPEHSLFRENLAAYLRNGLPEAYLETLGDRARTVALEDLPLFRNQRDSVVRDLRAPYTNAQVEARIDFAADQLAEAIREVRRLNGSDAPYRLYVINGFVHGRAAAYSDLDLMIDTMDEGLRRRVLGSRFGFRGRGDYRAHPVGIGPYEGGHGRLADLGDGRAFLENPRASLRAIYESGRARVAGAIDGRPVRLPIRETPEVFLRLRQLHYRRKIDLGSLNGRDLVAAMGELEGHRDAEVRATARETRLWLERQPSEYVRDLERLHSEALLRDIAERSAGRPERIFQPYPQLQALFRLARQHGVTLGVGGGLARDVILGRPVSSFSDLDLVYDSRQPGWKAFHAQLKKMVAQGEIPGLPSKFDYYADFNPQSDRSIDRVLTTRGFTFEKIVLMSDGSLKDSTGRGVNDLLEGRLDYHLFRARHEPLGVPTLLRMLRFKAQYPGFEFTPETEAMLREGVAAAREGEPRFDGMKRFGRWYRVTQPSLNAAVMALSGSGYVNAKRDLDKFFKNAVLRERAIELLVQYEMDATLKAMGMGQQLSEWVSDAQIREARLKLFFGGRVDPALRAKILSIKTWSDRELLDRLLEGLRRQGKPEVDAIGRRVAARIDGLNDVVAALREEASRAWRVPEAAVTEILEGIETTTVQARREHRRNFIKPVPSGEPTFGAVRESGWPAEALRFDVAQPNAAVDPARYARERLPEPMIRDIVERSVPVEVHSGTYEQTVGDLAARGYREVFRLDPVRGFMQKEILLAYDSRRGSYVYAVRNPYGVDAERHLFLMLRIATEGRVGSLTRVTHPAFSREDRVQRYRKLFEKSGYSPDAVLMGAGGGVFRSLRQRAAYGEAADVLAERYGPRFLEEAAAAVGKDGRGLAGRSSGAFLQDSALAERLVDVAKSVAQGSFADARLEDAKELFARAAVVAKERSGILYHERDRALTYEVYRYRDAAGLRRTLFVTDFLYGDAMAEAAEALARMGARKVLVLSGAGSLVAGDPVGMVRVPAEFHDASGRVEIRNGLLPFAPRDRFVTAGGRHGKSYSPLADTEASVSRMRAQGIDSVEVEVSEVARAMSSHPKVTFGSAITVMNVLGTRFTLDEHRVSNPNASRLTADMAMGFFEMAGLEGPLARASVREALLASAKRTPEDVATRLAERLANARGAGGPEYALYRENLAAYLRNGLPDAFLRQMKEIPESVRVEDFPLFARHKGKLLRDLERPYTNAEVDAHRDRLAEQLAEAIREVRALNVRGSEFRLLVGGSLVKGRLGAHSDVDVLIETRDAKLLARVLESRFGTDNPNNPKDGGIRVAPLTRAKILEHVAIQPLVDIADGAAFERDPRGAARRLYEAGRAPYLSEGRRMPRREAPEALDRLYDLERQGRVVLERNLASLSVEQQLKQYASYPDPAVRQTIRELAEWYGRHPEAARPIPPARPPASQPRDGVGRSIKDKLSLVEPWIPADARTIVDVGTGKGILAAVLSKRHAGAQVVGLDISPEMVEHARQRHGSRGNLRFLRGTANDVVARDAGAVIFTHVMHEVYSAGGRTPEAVRAALRASFEMLGPGGRVIIRDFVRPEGGERLVRLTHATSDIVPGHSFEDFARAFEWPVPVRKVSETAERVTYETTLESAYEFIYRKDSHAEWDALRREKFGFWTAEEAQRLLAESGFRMIHRRTFDSSWIGADRLKEKVWLADARTGEALPLPKYQMVIVGEKGGQPSRATSGKRLAVREARAAGQFTAAFLVKEGMNAGLDRDPNRLAAAAQQLATTEFWYSLGVFTAGARGAQRVLESKSVAGRLPGAAKPLARSSVPLAAGMAATELSTGHFDPARVAAGTASYFAVGTALERTLYPAMTRLGPAGKAAGVVTSALTLFFGEKAEAALLTRGQSSQH